MTGIDASANCACPSVSANASAAGFMSGEWNGPDTARRTTLRAPAATSICLGSVERLGRARDDRLPGRVVVGDPHAFDVRERRLDLRPLPCRGSAAMPPGVAAAASAISRLRSTTSSRPGLDRERPGDGQRGELAEGVACDRDRLEARVEQRASPRPVGEEEQRLCGAGVGEVLGRVPRRRCGAAADPRAPRRRRADGRCRRSRAACRACPDAASLDRGT